MMGWENIKHLLFLIKILSLIHESPIPKKGLTFSYQSVLTLLLFALIIYALDLLLGKEGRSENLGAYMFLLMTFISVENFLSSA